MTQFKKTNQVPMEQILVVKGDVASPTGALVNTTTALNIGDGVVGTISWDFGGTKTIGNFITSSDDSNEVQAIKVVQGTPNSANITAVSPWEVADPGFVESGIIRKDMIRSVASKKARFGKVGAQSFEGFGTFADNTEYKAYLRLLSVRKDRFFGDNDEVISAIVPATNFTALGTANKTDYVLTNLAAKFNTSSKVLGGNRNFVVLLAKGTPTAATAPTVPTVVLTGGVVTSLTGGTGGSGYTSAPTVVLTGGSPTTAAVVTAQINAAGAITGYTIVNGGAGYGTVPTASFTGGNGTVIGTLAPNASVPVMVYKNTTYNLTVTTPMLIALADLIVKSPALSGTSTIVPIDTSIEGGFAKGDVLIVLGLPHATATAFDDVEQVMVTPELNLGAGFISAGFTKQVAPADEGTGQGRKWQIQWRNRVGLNVHTPQVQPFGDYFSEGYNYINESKMYTSLEIEYYDVENTLTGTPDYAKRLIVLLPAEVASSFTINVNNIVTRLLAGNSPINIINSNDAGTGTASSNSVSSLNAILVAWLEHARTTGNPFQLLGDAVAGTYV